MEPDTGRGPASEVAFAAASYILWFVSAAAGVVTLLVARQLLIELTYALQIDPWVHGAIDKFGLFFFAIVWTVLAYVTEYYYRRGAAVDLRQLLRRFGLVTGTQIVFSALAWAAILLMS